MSLAERVKQTGARILTLDIERMKGRASVEFWDLGDFKNRRIHADDVVEHPRTILVAWKWLGESKVHHAAEWGEGGADEMHRQVWDAVDASDVIVGHNVWPGFDLRHLNTAWRDMGLPPPSPYKVVDTLTVARRTFGDESRTLNALCQRLGLQGKVDRYDVEVARAACAGNHRAQSRLTRYCKFDVKASEALYLRLAGTGWMPGHPHNKRHQAALVCNQCWGENLSSAGEHLASLYVYELWRCDDCGANVQGKLVGRVATSRGAR